MRMWILAALAAAPVAAAGGFGLAYANSQGQSYTCPLTGGQLPCPNCCPLNKSKQRAKEQPVTCPVTGEELPCPNCCPLNKSK